MKIILASSSPRRKKILKEMGIKFKVVHPNIKEKIIYNKPHKLVMELSKIKALSVAKQYPYNVVIGADTIVYCKGKIIGKPKNIRDAKRLLKIQSDSWQKVYTGVTIAILGKGLILTDYEKSLCYMRKLNDNEIDKIAKRHLDKAGGWAVQDNNDKLIKKIIGDYTNVVGFPKKLVKKMLKKINILCYKK
ncbi:MAG: Maf family protein [Elusimicrobiales bacterium]|nr:Maf family protein [Elusimicrobiales bacterium]